ncbi:MAG: carbohydrate ABC transporter permease [Christensenellales bacterium]
MKRSHLAALLAIAFLVTFFLGGVTAAMTAKETAVSTEVSLGKVLFSLSSAFVLLLPLSLFTMIIAFISLLKDRRSAGMLFSGIAALSFLLFVVFFSMEKSNNSLYALLSAKLKDAGVTFRKRDTGAIAVNFSWTVYLTLALGIGTMLVASPALRTQNDRHLVRRDLLPYAYISPHLFFFIIFFITPAIYGIYAAFTKWDLFNDPVWVGLDNFRVLLAQPGNTYYVQLRNGLWNTIKFVLYAVPFCILVPLSLAVLLQAKSRGSKFFQSIYYLPSLMSITTVTLAWRYMFFKAYGVMNHFFMTQPDWFTPPYSWIMLVVVTVWWVNGGTMVIYQSALASIPVEHYEAASVDGASAWQKFLYITLPGMRYPLMFTLMMAIIAQFNIYGQPLILTGFANQEANAVLLMYVYENAVKKQAAGMSASMALILGMCILAVSFLQMRVTRANADPAK